MLMLLRRVLALMLIPYAFLRLALHDFAGFQVERL